MGWGLVALAFHALAHQLAVPPDRLRLLARLAFRGLFVGPPQFHLTENALALHFLLQRLQGLVDVVVAYDYLNDLSYS